VSFTRSNTSKNKKGEKEMAVIKFNFLSRTLGMQVNITALLPSFSFVDAISGKRDFYVKGMKFQTLYLLHGGLGDDSDYINFSNIARYADNNKIAVIMPADYNAFYSDTKNGGKYWQYTSEEVPEVCQALFPLSEQREDNFVAGLSMGAHGAMKMGILNPERFAAVLCMSGAAFTFQDVQEQTRTIAGDVKNQIIDMSPLADDRTNDVFSIAKANIEQGKQLPKFFFSCGGNDFILPMVKKSRDYLSGIGYDVSYDEIPGYGHEWDFWDLTLKKALNEWLPIRHSIIYPEA